MEGDLACVKCRSISLQEVDVSGIAGQNHFEEVQETQVTEDFIELGGSGKLKNESGNVNSGVENHSTGCPEDLPTTISLVSVDENQELKGLWKVEEKLSLGSVGDTEEIPLVESAGYESVLVGSANESGQNHSVKSNDLENRNNTVSEVKRMTGNLEVIDDTAVIDCTLITSGNGYGSEKIRPRTDEKREKRTRRREKGGKQGLEGNGKGNNVGRIVEVLKSGSGRKRIYSRKEMEVLRYVNTEEQLKMWMVVRCSLGSVVLKEYDGLEKCVNQKRIRVNFDPRQQFAKKEEAPAILGMFFFFVIFCSFIDV